ncbi:hypothetical protein [Paenibacillus sp. Aloe-11]|uniref:hypothetical protein n=1 Tax=Paenibacillus sp. Aloe-11 TaxID=1050222 RepID=UPI003FA61379
MIIHQKLIFRLPYINLNRQRVLFITKSQLKLQRYMLNLNKKKAGCATSLFIIGLLLVRLDHRHHLRNRRRLASDRLCHQDFFSQP